MKIKDIFNKDKIFFISDPHFYHNNIIKYTNRPFNNIDDMNKTIVSNWNNKVPKDGIVFLLGDVALTSKPLDLFGLLSSLNGTIHLIIGNHERDALKKEYIRQRWTTISDILEITVNDNAQDIIMCHYPMLTWNCSHRGSWQLFGHVHGNLNKNGEMNHNPNQLDVGVDLHNFTPLSYNEIKTIINKQNGRI